MDRLEYMKRRARADNCRRILETLPEGDSMRLALESQERSIRRELAQSVVEAEREE